MLRFLPILASLLQSPPSQSPKASYWQQEVAYEITASLDEPSGVLSGSQRITYYNRSPDTLTTFSLHLYLNAFRPGSRWADRDSVEGRRRFNDLKDPDYAFNHVRNVRIMGDGVEAIYPFAPDSTIVRFKLPQPLAPGDSMVAEMDWDARPSTTPRRQGRQGRRFDFAQWYPRVVTYDTYGWNEHPLYPAGEFYGEFGTFLVKLDVSDDQVVGATGVPLCGDPGWERANQNPARAVEYGREFYPNAPGYAKLPEACGKGNEYTVTFHRVEPGRKRIIWYARDVHHFAMSLSPDYRYEGGSYGGIAVHVLYSPGDEESWGNRIVVKRTESALAWLDSIFGKYPWPQITNVHRIEGGGTEFPMMIMDGSASEGLILHELGHNYLMGILANNEWREGWLDEGFTEFQTNWYFENRPEGSGYAESEASMLAFDIDDYSEPTSLVSEHYRDFTTYNIMIYGRGELFFHQLRYIVGDDVFRRILRTYYDRWKLKHVDEHALLEIAEEVSRRDLSTFFWQWLHGTELYDYAVGRVKTERREIGAAEGGSDGRSEPPSGWLTRVEVLRKSPGRIPVEVMVVGERDSAIVRSEGLAEREWVEVATQSKPRVVQLDPAVQTHDWNMLNNRKLLGFQPGKHRWKTDHHIDRFFSTPHHRDAMAVIWAPTVWYNDAGGITLALRSRESYLGRFEQNVLSVGYSTGWASDLDADDVDVFFRWRNPTWLYGPKLGQSFEIFSQEGRSGASLLLEKTRRDHLTFGPTYVHGIALQWLNVDDRRYVDPGYYEDAGTVELVDRFLITKRSSRWTIGARVKAGGGVSFAEGGSGLTTERRYDTQAYLRGTAEATARRSLGAGFGVGLRGFAGFTAAPDRLIKQRQIYLAGADPYEQFNNPFLRSRGALLVGDDVHYHAPGGGGLRGIDPRVSTAALLALNVELDRTLVSRGSAKLFRRVSLAAFGDLAHTVSDRSVDRAGEPIEFLADAGIGLRADHRIGETTFVTRIDLPLWVSRPEFAHDQHPGNDEFGFRWTLSFEPAW